MTRRHQLMSGAKLGIPIAIGYIPIAIAFGVLTTSSGINLWVGVALSSVLYAGAAQFVGVGMMVAGASMLEIVMTTLILNFRHFIMSSALSQRMPAAISRRFLAVLSFGITDESFSVAAIQPQPILAPWTLIGLNTMAYLAWNTGTLIGLLLGDAVPQALSASMGIALYAMFVGLLIPGLRNSRPMVMVTLVSVLISSLIFYAPPFSNLASGWRILFATMSAAGVGSVLISTQDEVKEGQGGNNHE